MMKEEAEGGDEKPAVKTQEEEGCPCSHMRTEYDWSCLP